MRLVVDANVIISALLDDSTSRELLVTLEPDLLTPAFVRQEISNYEDLIVEKSGMSHERVAQFVELLFQYIETVPAEDIYPQIDRAEGAIGDTDPDDVLYLACALTVDAAIWSDDADFEQQDLVPVYSTGNVLDAFEVLQPDFEHLRPVVLVSVDTRRLNTSRSGATRTEASDYRGKWPPLDAYGGARHRNLQR